MKRPKIEREILRVLMKSPLYFTIPLQKRLEFIMFFSQQSVYHRFCAYNKRLINGKADTIMGEMLINKQ